MSEFCSKRFESTNFHQLNISPLFLSSDSFLKVMTRVRKPQNIYTKKDKKKITQREKDRGAIIQMPDMFGWWKASREKDRLDSKMAAYQKKKKKTDKQIWFTIISLWGLVACPEKLVKSRPCATQTAPSGGNISTVVGSNALIIYNWANKCETE